MKATFFSTGACRLANSAHMAVILFFSAFSGYMMDCPRTSYVPLLKEVKPYCSSS